MSRARGGAAGGVLPQPADERWFVERRWPDGLRCPDCGGDARYIANRTPAPFRCRTRSCGKQFSVKSGTLMAGSTMSLLRWRMAFEYLRGRLWTASALDLARHLDVTRPCAQSVLLRVQRAVRGGEWLPFPRSRFG